MRALASTVIRYRSLVLAVVCIGTVWFAFHAATLRMDPDLLSFLPAEDDDVRFFRETSKRFYTNEINMIALESDDIFTHDALGDLRKVTRAVQMVRGVRHVLGLTNLLDVARDPEGSTVVRPLIDPSEVPSDPAELSALRKKVLSTPVLVGNLVSKDGRAAMLTLILDPQADKMATARAIREAAVEAAPDRHLVFGGFAMALDTLRSLGTRDIVRWVPLTALAIPLLLFLGMGTLRGVLLPLATVTVAIVWTLGTLAIDGMVLSMLTALIPAVILILGTAPGIHIVACCQGENPPGGKEVVERVLARESGKILLAGLVIFAGFLSLMLSNLTLFREFGKAAAIGVFWSVALALTFLPAWVSYLSGRPVRSASLTSPQNQRVASTLTRIANLAPRRRVPILMAAGLVCLGSLVLATGIPRHMDMLSAFPRGSEPHQAERVLQDHFGGSQVLQVSFRAADVRAPAILEQMELLEKRLRLLEGVRYPQSVAGVVKELNLNLNHEPGLPDSLAKVHNMWFMLEGQAFLDAILYRGYGDGVVVARIGGSDPKAIAVALERVERLVQETVPEELYVVDIQDKPLPIQQHFLDVLAARTALKASLDIRFHTGRDVPEGELAAALGRLLRTPPALVPADREVVASRIEAFLLSGESDVRIRRTDRIPDTAARLAGKESVSPDTLEAVLRESLPPGAWTGSEQDLVFTAEFIRMIFDQRLREARLEQAMHATRELAGLGPGGWEMNPALAEDLAASLWGLNNSFIAVDEATWLRVTGRERPWKSRVAFEARLTGLPVINLKYDRILFDALLRAVFNGLVILLVLFIFLLRSPVAGFAATSVLLFASLPVVGAMSLLGVSVDNMTLVFLSLAAGIGVAYALPSAAGMVEAPVEGKGRVAARALARARTVLIHMLALAPGFAVLGLCSLVPLRLLGLFIALALVLASAGTWFLLPALLWSRKHAKGERSRDDPELHRV